MPEGAVMPSDAQAGFGSGHRNERTRCRSAALIGVWVAGSPAPLCRCALLARGIRKRTAGLMGRRELAPLDGLWLEPGRSIHTFGMRFAIDCIFLDNSAEIVRICLNVPPNRIRLGPRKTRHVLELAAGTGESLAHGQRLLREFNP